MTLQNAMDEVAKADGHETGWDFNYEFKLNLTSYDIQMRKAAELYASKKADSALQIAVNLTDHENEARKQRVIAQATNLQISALIEGKITPRQFIDDLEMKLTTALG